MPGVVALVPVRLQVRDNLGFLAPPQPFGAPLPGDLVAQGSPVRIVRRRLVADDLQMAPRSPRAPSERRSIRWKDTPQAQALVPSMPDPEERSVWEL